MRNFLTPLFVLFSSIVIAQQPNTEALRQKTIVLRRFLEQNHYQPLQWNDTTSARLYNRWMELLDDEKLIFSQTEITQLNVYIKKLDEEMMGKQWNFFNKSMALYKTSLFRVDSVVKNILANPLDFSKPDNLNWPLTAFANDRTDVYKVWQQYLKWKILRAMADVALDTAGKNKPSTTLAPAEFAAIEKKSREQVKKQELMWVQNKLAAIDLQSKEMEDNYLSAISWCYDPHTEYMNTEEKGEFDTEMSGVEFTTGFEMDENEKGEWVISHLVPGGPAWRNGELHKGDVILKIKSGDKPEVVLADGTGQLDKVFDGNSNEKITITVRTISGAIKTAVLSKEKITNEEGVVKSYLLNGSKKIGYITLPGFYVKEGDEDNANGCSNDVAKEVVKLKKDSIAGLILDLRYNGGGSLGEALELAGIFISEGPLTSTRDKSGKVHFLKDPNRGIIYDGPLLIMVNTMSASASELVSAVLQDYHRALIVGSATYGKGSAQVILPMDTTDKVSETAKYNSYVKVTHGKFYRVDGSTTQWKGVIPDIELPDMYAMDKFREKGVVSALQPDYSKPAMYRPLSPIPFARIKDQSIARVNGSQAFKAVSSFFDWYKTMSGVRTIPLQWSNYLSYYKKITGYYNSLLPGPQDPGNLLKAVNNSMDMERRQVITEQSKTINEVSIKRIEKDNYIAECYKIMQDWLKEL
ncbi:MAG: S41 family peptidase [Ferruginibacter sp.]